MADIEKYREVIKDILVRYGPPASSEDVDVQMVVDTEHDHYQLVHVGWVKNKQRIYGCVLHIDIKGDKLWIQHDGTEIGIANELVAAGIPNDKIVLGFLSPFKRQFSDFGTG